VAHQVCILYAVTHGFLKDIAVDKVAEFEARLYEFMDNRHEDVLRAIRSTGKLEKDTEDALSAALTELLTEFVVSE
jgi:F-type H+-transporting ATPase subunit alpha